MARQIVIGLITLYQKTLSPDQGIMRIFFPGGVCRFQPTCSEYAKEAVSKYGVFKGLALGSRRVARCHPGNPGGYDPVQ
ncbi:MAG TPA: membrane protein insertion efficiency factor YidD [Candidatus Saccharimonadales bacterium]|nr:membrane protein insertion efficiency factor YidD [Candidatus Saccharimonadales bacterium]